MKVNIENLTKTYNEVVAVNGLSVKIKDGELVSILGPSGCGKSTLLYMLAGIIEPTNGDIYFDGNRINEVPIENRNIGLVFQNYSLYPHMTVLENLIFPLKMQGIKKREAIDKGKEISGVLKIENLLKRKPKELSGGQQQRVAIGRALIKKPNLLLMDEPFSNLDAALRVEMREEIKALQKDFNITTLFVTHDQEEALSISDRILLMNKGELMQFDDPKKIYQEPHSMYVANFIGSPKINIIYDEKVICNFINDKDLKEDGIKALGIRPEDIILTYENYNYDKNLKGKVMNVQSLGRDTHFKIDIQGTILRGILSGSSHLSEGQVVNLYFRKVHFFKE